jgi:hypothetical protein
MSNTNLPPSFAVELSNQLGRTVTQLKQLSAGIESLKRQLPRQFDPIMNLTSVFQESEKIQKQALAAGTTYGKFLEANTESMKGLMSSNQAMTRFMLTGFTRGLRDVSDETMALADVMNITGEDTGALAKTFGQVRLLTGNSINATSNLAKTIVDTTRDSGVSRGQLVQALDSFSQSLFDASIYGEQAVGGLAELGVTLKGGLAGAAGADKAINTLLGMQDSLNVAQQEQLGLRQFFDEIRANGFNADRHLGMLVQAGERLNDLMGEDPMRRSAISKAFGNQQVRSLMLISDGIQNFEGTSEDMKATQEESLQSMKAFEERKRKFFEVLAPELHGVITRVLPMLAAGQVLGQGITAVGAARTANRVQRMGAARTAFRGALGQGLSRSAARTAASTAMKSVAGFGFRRGIGTAIAGFAGGPIGLGLAALTFVPDLVNLMSDVKDNTAKTAEVAEKELQERKAQLASDQQRLSTLAAMGKDALVAQGLLASKDSAMVFQQVVDSKFTELGDKIARSVSEAYEAGKAHGRLEK